MPEDRELLAAMVRTLLAERNHEKQRAEEQKQHAQSTKHSGLKIRWSCCACNWSWSDSRSGTTVRGRIVFSPRDELSQLLLNFAEQLEQKPIHPDDLPPQAEQEQQQRRRQAAQRAAPSCQLRKPSRHHARLRAERRTSGPAPAAVRRAMRLAADESWQVEYLPGHFERIHHVRKKYACASCEGKGEHPQMEVAAKPEAAIDKGMAGPGLLAFIVTSKFADYLPLYRLEDIFQRQGFEISRATQSVWCGDVADLVEPLYQLMAERVRASHVVATDDTIMPMLSPGKTANARMWVYVGDDAHPYNVFHFTLNRGRDGPKYFLKDYRQVLLADAYGGYNGVVAGNEITRAGCWSHARRKIIEAEKTAPEIARRGDRDDARTLCGGETGQGRFPSQSGSTCVRSSRRRCWPNCDRSC